jgi:hypothetical protein
MGEAMSNNYSELWKSFKRRINQYRSELRALRKLVLFISISGLI